MLLYYFHFHILDTLVFRKYSFIFQSHHKLNICSYNMYTYQNQRIIYKIYYKYWIDTRNEQYEMRQYFHGDEP